MLPHTLWCETCESACAHGLGLHAQRGVPRLYVELPVVCFRPSDPCDLPEQQYSEYCEVPAIAGNERHRAS